MSQGLQIFNEFGETTLDTNVQTTSIIGKFIIDKVGTVSITDSRFGWGTPFFISDSIYSGTELKGSFSGEVFTITAISRGGGFTNFKPVTIFYGVF